MRSQRPRARADGPDNKKLDPDQTSQALRFTTMQPQERLKAISKAVTSLSYRDNELCVRAAD